MQRARRAMANQCTGKAASEIPALKPYPGKPAVRNFRGDGGNAGIIEARLAPPSYSTINSLHSDFRRLSTLLALLLCAYSVRTFRASLLPCGFVLLCQMSRPLTAPLLSASDDSNFSGTNNPSVEQMRLKMFFSLCLTRMPFEVGSGRPVPHMLAERHRYPSCNVHRSSAAVRMPCLM
jgi:hypothetical protein